MVIETWYFHTSRSHVTLCHAMATVGKSFQTEQATDHGIVPCYGDCGQIISNRTSHWSSDWIEWICIENMDLIFDCKAANQHCYWICCFSLCSRIIWGNLLERFRSCIWTCLVHQKRFHAIRIRNSILWNRVRRYLIDWAACVQRAEHFLTFTKQFAKSCKGHLDNNWISWRKYFSDLFPDLALLLEDDFGFAIGGWSTTSLFSGSESKARERGTGER